MPGRFAPTPSGRMHIGNIVAMFAAWASARCQQDTIFLRIEDLDTPRVVKDADKWIIDDLQWLGLDFDGEPVYQSQRTQIYEQVLASLIEHLDVIYPCFCSRAQIRAASAPQEGDGFIRYPGTCAHLDQTLVHERLARSDQHSLRMRAARPEDDDTVIFDDRVFGAQSFNLVQDVGDWVIRRADGLMAYQYAVVIDDLLMGVDDVVRGRDLLRSTAIQIRLRQYLLDAGIQSDNCAAAHPRYAHIPLMDNAAGKRLAKRERSLDMGVLRREGITSEQIIGFCAWVLGLCDGGRCAQPVPMSAREALELFSWDCVKHNRSDYAVPDNFAQILTRM